MVAIRTLPALAVALASGACAHAPPPVRATPLELDDTGAGLRAFVSAEVKGKPVRLLLDTGSARNLLPAPFASALRLRTGKDAFAATLVDANGHQATLASLPAVPVRIEGAPASARIDFHADASGARDGILAPQTLLAPGWALVIDLARGELRFDPEDEARRRLPPEVGGRLRRVPYERCTSSGPFERTHRVVEASVNGVAARMVVDTGAQVTSLTRNNPAIPTLATAQGTRHAVRGTHSTGQGLAIGGVPIEVAGAGFSQVVSVLPAPSPCWDGALGTDVLRHCTIVWGWSELWLACRPPAAASALAAGDAGD